MSVIGNLGHTLEVFGKKVGEFFSGLPNRITEFFWKNVFKGMVFEQSKKSLGGRQIEVLTSKADNFFIKYIKRGRVDGLFQKIIKEDGELNDEEWVEFKELISSVKNITKKDNAIIDGKRFKHLLKKIENNEVLIDQEWAEFDKLLPGQRLANLDVESQVNNRRKFDSLCNKIMQKMTLTADEWKGFDTFSILQGHLSSTDQTKVKSRRDLDRLFQKLDEGTEGLTDEEWVEFGSLLNENNTTINERSKIYIESFLPLLKRVIRDEALTNKEWIQFEALLHVPRLTSEERQQINTAMLKRQMSPEREERRQVLLSKLQDLEALTTDEERELEDLSSEIRRLREKEELIPRVRSLQSSDEIVRIPQELAPYKARRYEKLISRLQKPEKLTTDEERELEDLSSEIIALRMTSNNRDILTDIFASFSVSPKVGLPKALTLELQTFLKDFEKASPRVRELFYQMDPISSEDFGKLSRIIEPMQSAGGMNPAEENPQIGLLQQFAVLNMPLMTHITSPALDPAAPPGESRPYKYEDRDWFVLHFQKEADETFIPQPDLTTTPRFQGQDSATTYEDRKYPQTESSRDKAVIAFPAQIVRETDVDPILLISITDHREEFSDSNQIEFTREAVQEKEHQPGEEIQTIQSVNSFRPKEDSRTRRIILELLNRKVDPTQVQKIIKYGLNQGSVGKLVEPISIQGIPLGIMPQRMRDVRMRIDIAASGNITIVYEIPNIEIKDMNEKEVARLKASFTWDVATDATHVDYQFLGFEPEAPLHSQPGAGAGA